MHAATPDHLKLVGTLVGSSLPVLRNRPAVFQPAYNIDITFLVRGEFALGLSRHAPVEKMFFLEQASAPFKPGRPASSLALPPVGMCKLLSSSETSQSF